MENLIQRYEEVYERFSLLYFKEFDGRTLGMSDREYTYLKLISNQGQVTPSDFATLAHMTRAGATQIINKFEQKGWVIKEPSKKDKRSVDVRLSSETEAYFQQIYQQLAMIYQGFFGILTPEEQKQLAHILDKLAQSPLD